MKKMNMRKLLKNKGETLKLTTLGFTLVELLAVIVILAIVLIIAVPGVIGIIKKTKNNSYDVQLKIIKDAAKNFITMERKQTIWHEYGASKMTVISLDQLQKKGYLDQKVIDPRTKEVITDVAVSVMIDETNHSKYEIVYSDSSNANYPVFSEEMIPIAWDGNQWIKADFTNTKQAWFDYSKQEWANIAVTTLETRKTYQEATVGTPIPITDIDLMYTWIPRYKYKLWNVDNFTDFQPSTYLLDVRFESNSQEKSKGTKNGDWLTHPAFTFGEEELSGFWMAKFETGYQGSEKVKPVIKPNVNSWNSISLKNAYLASFNLKDTYQMPNNDTHLIKNMEWGAMSYLTASNYGKIGNKDYTGEDKQVKINNSSPSRTGCGAVAQNAGLTGFCYEYDTVSGMGASTTGNVTGVYDTSGGLWDFTMDFTLDPVSGDFFTESSGFTQDEMKQIASVSKYVGVYYSGVELDYSRGHLGDATKELGKFVYVPAPGMAAYSSWYQDYAHLTANHRPFLLRGGNAGHGIWSGTFAFVLDRGAENSVIGYRVVLL